jgi:[CysO sulfur-carrier protein]-S-L-cysteine hydrolase
VPVLVLPNSCWQRIVAHCLDCLPLEACGLLAGLPADTGARPASTGHASAGRDSIGRDSAGPASIGHASADAGAAVHEVYPTANAARSARLYTVEPKELLLADRSAEAAGLALIGVWHSHTHTPAYPSPTDVAQAPDPEWHYVLVSLADAEPVVRSYRIIGDQVREEIVAGLD